MESKTVTESSPTRRLKCSGCERPLSACWCAFVRPVSTPHRILVLQHPREARAAFGTVRILRQAISEVTIRVGINFTLDAAVAEALSYPTHQPVLLFPRRDAAPREMVVGIVPLTLVVIDGTWTQARSIMRVNRWLLDLPHYQLEPTRRSIYSLRSQPQAEYLSSLEAVAEVLSILQGDPDIHHSLLSPLRAMVGMQLACSDARTSEILCDRALLTRVGYLPPSLGIDV